MALASCQWVTSQAPYIATELQEVQALPAPNTRGARKALRTNAEELSHWSATVLKSGAFSQTVGWSGVLGKAGELVTTAAVSPPSAGKKYIVLAERALLQAVDGCKALQR